MKRIKEREEGKNTSHYSNHLLFPFLNFQPSLLDFEVKIHGGNISSELMSCIALARMYVRANVADHLLLHDPFSLWNLEDQVQFGFVPLVEMVDRSRLTLFAPVLSKHSLTFFDEVILFHGNELINVLPSNDPSLSQYFS